MPKISGPVQKSAPSSSPQQAAPTFSPVSAAAKRALDTGKQTEHPLKKLKAKPLTPEVSRELVQTSSSSSMAPSREISEDFAIDALIGLSGPSSTIENTSLDEAIKKCEEEVGTFPNEFPKRWQALMKLREICLKSPNHPKQAAEAIEKRLTLSLPNDELKAGFLFLLATIYYQQSASQLAIQNLLEARSLSVPARLKSYILNLLTYVAINHGTSTDLDLGIDSGLEVLNLVLVNKEQLSLNPLVFIALIKGLMQRARPANPEQNQMGDLALALKVMGEWIGKPCNKEQKDQLLNQVSQLLELLSQKKDAFLTVPVNHSAQQYDTSKLASLTDPLERAKELVEYGRFLIKTSKFELATSTANEGLALPFNDDLTKAKLISVLTMSQCKLNKFSHPFFSCMPFGCTDPLTQAELSFSACQYHRKNNKIDLAIKSAQDALDIPFNDRDLRFDLIDTLCTLYYQKCLRERNLEDLYLAIETLGKAAALPLTSENLNALCGYCHGFKRNLEEHLPNPSHPLPAAGALSSSASTSSSSSSSASLKRMGEAIPVEQNGRPLKAARVETVHRAQLMKTSTPTSSTTSASTPQSTAVSLLPSTYPAPAPTRSVVPSPFGSVLAWMHSPVETSRPAPRASRASNLMSVPIPQRTIPTNASAPMHSIPAAQLPFLSQRVPAPMTAPPSQPPQQFPQTLLAAYDVNIAALKMSLNVAVDSRQKVQILTQLAEMYEKRGELTKSVADFDLAIELIKQAEELLK